MQNRDAVSSRRIDIQGKGRILILKSRVDSLRAAEDYLRSVGYKIESAVDILSAISMLEARPPDYVLIAVENPDPRTQSLPDLIGEAYPETRVVLYADSVSGQRFQSLKGGKSGYTLFPPVSGYSIDRMLARTQRDAEREVYYARRYKGAPSTIELDVMGRDQARRDLSVLARSGLTGARVDVRPTKDAQFTVSLDRVHRAMKGALELSFRHAPPTASSEKIGVVNKVAAITIRSSSITGYLIVAYGEDRLVDSEFMASLRRGFIHIMHLEDQTATTGSEMTIDLNNVYFEEWAERDAAFWQKSLHIGHEVAVAFYPPEAPQPPIRTTVDGLMCILNMSEIQGDAKIEFDLYLYLPNNQKMLLYGRRGQRLPAEQRDRLVLKGIKEMYIAREDEATIETYRAQNYLNRRIAAACGSAI